MMDWTTKPLGKLSSLSGKAFAEGDRVVSFVVRGDSGALERRDFLEGELTRETAPAGEVLGRWTRVVRAKPVSEAQARAQQLAGAEEMFLGLANADGVASADGAPQDGDRDLLVRLLALVLERKRILRALGRPQDGVQRYAHAASGVQYDVRLVEMTPEGLARVQPQLPAFD